MAGNLLLFARHQLLGQIAGATRRVWLTSPFLTFPIAAKLREAAERSAATDLRMLTSLAPRSVQVGVLSPQGLSLLRDGGFEIASIPNLHAKASLVDGWGLVGSGNLTGTGLGGAEGGNLELGVVLSPTQVDEASDVVNGWWKKAKPVGDEQIAQFAALPRFTSPQGTPPPLGSMLGLVSEAGLEALLDEGEGVATSRRYWIKSNFHRPGEEQWWHRDWISDWREAPYGVGDLIVLYLSARDGGPARCPAVVQVTYPSHFNRAWVIAQRDVDAAERWPYVTKTSIVGEVPIAAGAPLSVIDKNGQSVQSGYCEIDRLEFERLVEAMLGRLSTA
jgi:PLD-like domain